MFNVTPVPQNNVNTIQSNENNSVNAKVAIGIPNQMEISEDMPALPESARISESVGQGACKWLDDYIAFSRLWSPRGYDGFHEACGLWLLSTAAAHRVGAHFGGPRYTCLYIGMIARSSMWAKTTTAKIAIDLLKKVDLAYLLAAEDSTPQRFLSEMTIKVPDNYDKLTPEGKKRAQLKIGLAGQRGWYIGEFGKQLAAMMREGGYMADLRGIIRLFDDGEDEYEYATIMRGSDVVKNPYLALLVSMPPSELKRYAKKGSELWGDGFLARFALVTPADGKLSRGRFPEGERKVPIELITPLTKWNNRLGIPDVEITDKLGPDKKPIGYDISVSPLNMSMLNITKDVVEAYYGYHDALLDLTRGFTVQDLDANYTRFSEKALRISILFASLSGCEQIELRHWAKAQAITERWRAGLHELYRQLNRPKESFMNEMEDRIINVLLRKEKQTERQLRQQTKLSSQEIRTILSSLIESEMVESAPAGKTVEYYLVPEQV